MVVDGGLDSGEALEGLDATEPAHGAFASSEDLVRVSGSIVEPSTTLLTDLDPEGLEGRAIGSEAVGHDDLGAAAISLHRAALEGEGGLAIPALRGIGLQGFDCVIDGAPEVMADAIDADEDFVDMPAPEREGPMSDTPLPDLRGEHGAEADLPEADGLVADVDATFEQQDVDLTQRQGIAGIHHHREA